MKKNLRKIVIMTMHAFFLGTVLQVFFLSMLLASELEAQKIQSVREAKIQVTLQEAGLEECFSAIESKTPYKFTYDEKIIRSDVKINYESNQRTVSELLLQISRVAGLKFRQVNNTINVQAMKKNGRGEESIEVILQGTTVTGRVTSAEDNTGLPGVNVIVKGTVQGTVTDLDGAYTINVPDDQAVLVYSSVGFISQEVTVGNRSQIDIVMSPDITALEEIVVVGYGTQKKESLTSAVEMVDGEILDNRPIRTVTEGLAGLVAGLNVDQTNGAPASDPNLNIRGFTGFNSQQSPLVLVDGVERTLGDINPADVESISVLKDAAASAIYGSRAPYGVILVTTKSGEKGAGINVTYNGRYNIGQPINVPSFADSWVFAERFNQAYRNALQNPAFSEEAIQRMRDYGAGVIDYTNIALPNGEWGRHWDGNDNNDWFDLALRNSIPSQQHTLNFSGGSNATTYYMGLGYNESIGLFEGLGDRRDRYNALLKVSTDATDWLNLNLSMNYIRTDEFGPEYQGFGRNYNTIFNVLSRTWPNWPDQNPNGSPHWLSPLPGFTGETGEEKLQRNDFVVTGGFDINPLEGWNITGNYTFNTFNNHFEHTSFPLVVINADGSVRLSGRASQQSFIERSMANRQYHTTNLFTSYAREFNEHYINVLAGYQNEYNRYEDMFVNRKDLYTQTIPTIGTSFGDVLANDDLYHWSTQGYFFRASYNYKEKYLLEFNGRYDAHSKFPKDIRWAFFPSIAGGWNVARENFWPTEVISSLKIRGSYTSSGDHGAGNYLYLPTMGTAQGAGDVLLEGGFPPMVFMPGLVSDELTWAKPRTLGIGADISIFNNRLEIVYDWYQRTVYDQAGPAEPLPETLGDNVPRKNNAVSETRGWEFTTKWRDTGFNIAGKPFNYHAEFRISDYVGYVVEYEENITGARSGTWTPGEVFGQNFMYTSNGIAQDVGDIEQNVQQGGAWYYPGDLMMEDLNGDGQINAGDGGYWYSMGDITKMGYNYPRYRYGMTLGATWNGIDLFVLLEGVGHWKMYSGSSWIFGSNSNQWSGGWYKEHEELGVWSPETPDAWYPRYAFNGKNYGRANDQYMLNLANLRVRNIRIGYNLPASLISRIKLRKVYLYSSIENAGYIYYNSWIKYDPELIDNYSGQGYPIQRVISFGLNVGL
jgi:TonB-linked SusC/RagA family outer membrane protein